jgi:RES domain-containing protein
MAEELDGAPVDESAASEPTGDGAESAGGRWSPEVQAEYTKKTQALAEERKAWESQRSQQSQQLQQYAQQVQQQGAAYQQQVQQGQQQQAQGSQQSMLDQLRGMSYLDGNTAAQLVERLVGEGITPLQKQLQQRDQALATIYQDYKTLRDTVGSAQGKQAERDLDTRFLELRDKHGLPDEDVVHELMKDVYYSHEGDDLNDQYPDMLGKRVDGLRKVFREMDRKAAIQAKDSPFPSRGGESSLASGKTGGYKTPEQRTNELWPMLNPGQTE